MASTSEVGHTKNLSKLETMFITCNGFGAIYNPSNPDLTIPALSGFYTESKAALKLVKTTQTPFDNIEGERKMLFKPLKPLATKILAALYSSGVTKTVIDDAETINRKIQGKRADNKPEETPPGETPRDKISVSQQSYDLQIDFFEKQIELISIQPKYNPNELPLKVVTLISYKTQLQEINTAVKEVYDPYNTAMNARDKKFYDQETGLVGKARLAKGYVKSVYGASSPEYKTVNALRFKVIKK